MLNVHLKIPITSAIFLSVEAISTPPSQVSPREEINFQSSQSGTGSNFKESEKHRKKQEKEMKQRAKEAERKKIKDEKRRLKEAEKEAKETRKKDNKLKSSNSIQVQPTLDDFRASGNLTNFFPILKNQFPFPPKKKNSLSNRNNNVLI